MKLIVVSISLFIVTSFVTATQVTPDPYHETQNNLIQSSRILSPGMTVGFTDYDWQGNPPIGRRFFISPGGGFHWFWIRGPEPSYYVFYYPPSYWLFTTLDGDRVCSMDLMGDGRALYAALDSVVIGYVVRVYIDAAEGAGTFTICDVPYTGMPSDPIWINAKVDYADYIYISMSSSTGLYMIKSTDGGTTWPNWILVDSTGGHESWADFTGKTALVYEAGTYFENVFYWETTDNGVTWSLDTIFIPLPQDSVVGYVWNSAVYDNNGYLHVVFNCIDTSQAGQGGPDFSGCRSQIRHWNQENGQFSIVASGWWTLNPGPGFPHPTVSECQITIDRTSGTLYSTWCQADSGDVAANGYTNLEIYGAYSTNNGTTWSASVNITNSQSPGAAAGYCENDCWQSIAEITHGDTVFIFYMNDKDAGCSVYGQGVPTDNPMLFYPYPFSTGIGEQKTTTPLSLSLKITPNPAARNINISYTLAKPGNISLKLYSIDGRLVRSIPVTHREAGSHSEQLDARMLANGTYFVVLEIPTCTKSHPIIVIH